MGVGICGRKGPSCGCPVCGSMKCVEVYDWETDTNHCPDCGWSDAVAISSALKDIKES